VRTTGIPWLKTCSLFPSSGCTHTHTHTHIHTGTHEREEPADCTRRSAASTIEFRAVSQPRLTSVPGTLLLSDYMSGNECRDQRSFSEMGNGVTASDRQYKHTHTHTHTHLIVAGTQTIGMHSAGKSVASGHTKGDKGINHKRLSFDEAFT
jgi:hypothetical protein